MNGGFNIYLILWLEDNTKRVNKTLQVGHSGHQCLPMPVRFINKHRRR